MGYNNVQSDNGDREITEEELRKKLVNLFGKVNFDPILEKKYLDSLDRQIGMIENFMEDANKPMFDIQCENLKMLYRDKDDKKGKEYGEEYNKSEIKKKCEKKCDDLESENKLYYISITAFSKRWSTTFKFDEDVSLVSMFVYCRTIFKNYNEIKLLRQTGDGYYKYEVKIEDKKITFRGDTMNSWKTTLNEFGKLYGSKYLEDEYVKNSLPWIECFGQIENYQEGKQLPTYITDFLEVVYTIGNFIPVPFIGKNSFNQKRGNMLSDYWDLALLLIYKWYQSPDEDNLKDFYLQRLVCDQEEIDLCRNWLDIFGDWNNFVEQNYMQPFVKEIECEEGKQYGVPLELWDGHFNGGISPIKDENYREHNKESDDWQFEQFFVNARIRILRRGELIANALIKNEKKDANDKKASN